MKNSMTRVLLAIPACALIASCASQKTVEIVNPPELVYHQGAEPTGLNARTVDRDERDLSPHMILLSSKFIELETKEFEKNEVINDRRMQMRMHSLSQMKGADLMSAPSVVTRSGTLAKIEVIREFPIKGFGEDEMVNLGITIEISGYGYKKGLIHLNGKSTVREIDTPEKEFGDSVAVTVQSTVTYFDITLKDGQTAQLICKDKGSTGQRLVFISPQLIDPSGQPVKDARKLFSERDG